MHKLFEDFFDDIDIDTDVKCEEPENKDENDTFIYVAYFHTFDMTDEQIEWTSSNLERLFEHTNSHISKVYYNEECKCLFFFFDNDMSVNIYLRFIRKMFMIIYKHVQDTELFVHLFNKDIKAESYAEYFSGDNTGFSASDVYLLMVDKYVNTFNLLSKYATYFLKPGQIINFFDKLNNKKGIYDRIDPSFIERGEYICDCVIPANIHKTDYYYYSVDINHVYDNMAPNECAQLITFRNYSPDYGFRTYFEKRADMSFVRYWRDVANVYEDDYALYGVLCDEVIDEFYDKPHKAKMYKRVLNGKKTVVIVLDDIFSPKDESLNVQTDYIVYLELFINSNIDANFKL